MMSKENIQITNAFPKRRMLMAIINSIHCSLISVSRRYYGISVFWCCLGRVLIILVVMAAFVNHQSYWRVVFDGAYAISDGFRWHMFALGEAVATIIFLLFCLNENDRDAVSLWTFGCYVRRCHE